MESSDSEAEDESMEVDQDDNSDNGMQAYTLLYSARSSSALQVMLVFWMP